MNGLVLVDKPGGCTSHDVVNRWRKLGRTKRVGHLGTLDPMATGLLALLTGPATRLAPFYEKAQKTYKATVSFGLTSDTYDAEGEVKATGAAIPDEQLIRSGLDHFRGKFMQMPPQVSAKKVNGVPAYKLARKKIAFELRPVAVEVIRLEAEEFSGRAVVLEITCSAGTYIRSIAHDLGKLLGCGALLSELRRTRIGEFEVSQARTIANLELLSQAGKLAEAVIPASQLLSHIPAEHVSAETAAHIRQGRQFRTSPFVVPAEAPFVRALSRSGDLIAIGKLLIPNVYHPATVFQAESNEDSCDA